MTEATKKTDVVFEWWRDRLADRDSGPSRALAARLRRADLLGALAEPEVHALARRLGVKPAGAEGLARLVQVLAEVRENDGARLAQHLGAGDPKALSTLRFQRLLRTRGEDLSTAIRRALPMVGRKCNVAALGRDLLNWDHPEWGDRTRADWCFDYFRAPPPERDAKTETTSEETPA